VETRALLDEICSFDRKGLFDLGHPLLNRIAESFVKAAGIGAVQAVSREAYFTAIDGKADFLNWYTHHSLYISRVRHQYDTYNYTELCHFLKLLAVSVSLSCPCLGRCFIVCYYYIHNLHAVVYVFILYLINI